jgi:transcriptional regulator with XRE-family HTH domain
MPTIGKKLEEARRQEGLSVEDVAHETHIHSSMIRGIEDDDFSMFPSVTYAKSFLRQYSDLLGVDISDAVQDLNSGVMVRLGDNEFMNEMKKTIRKDRRFRLERRPRSVRRKLEKPGGAPIFLNLLLVVLIAALAIFYFLGFQTESPEEARKEIREGLARAIPFGEHAEDPELPVAGPPDFEVPLADNATTSKNRSERAPTRLQAIDLDGETPALASRQKANDGEEARFAAEPTPVARESEALPKPDVVWQIRESMPHPLARREASAVARPPRARAVPGIRIETEVSPPPIRSADLPAVRRILNEPAAELRPPGTEPPIEVHENRSTVGRKEETPKPPLRAVPVARNN